MASDFVRLAPSVPGLKGSVWRQTPNEYKEWEVEFQFKAFGQGQVGGRGLAFWYTQERAIEGNVFGSKDQWRGLGVFLDTADPANQVSPAPPLSFFVPCIYPLLFSMLIYQLSMEDHTNKVPCPLPSNRETTQSYTG